MKVAMCLFSLCMVQAHQEYALQIPNGHVLAYGHEDATGGGPLNAFGQDFKTAGLTWTKDLCEKDSNKDGQSNGAQLGDPNCVWTVGSTPEITDVSQLSHPGAPAPTTMSTPTMATEPTTSTTPAGCY